MNNDEIKKKERKIEKITTMRTNECWEVIKIDRKIKSIQERNKEEKRCSIVQ